MKRGFGTMTPRKMLAVYVSIFAYVLILALLVFLKYEEGKQTHEPVYGSVENRFRSNIVLEHEGEKYYYRQNEITNYLLIGLDNNDVNQLTVYQKGGQADFLVVLSIDRVNRTITPIMLDRDTMTEVQTYGIFGDPSGTKVMQLCLAQSYAPMRGYGGTNTVRSVEKLLHGIKIDYYVTLDIDAVPVVNDAVGGVEVTLQDDFSMYDPEMVKGATVRLEGKQAEFFVRGRMTVADGTNQSRMTRQNEYIKSFIVQFRKVSQEDPKKLSEILDKISGYMETNASRDTLIYDAGAYGDYMWQPMKNLKGTHTVDEHSFAEFWVESASLKELVLDIWFMKEE